MSVVHSTNPKPLLSSHLRASRVDVDDWAKESWTVLNLYNNGLSTNYDIFLNAYVQAKTKGLTMIQKARDFKQVGALQLYFLTCNGGIMGMITTKHSIFKKMYDYPYTKPQGHDGGDFV